MPECDSKLPPGRPLHCLYVEDDSNDAFFARHAFRKAAPEASLIVVADGREAQSYLLGSDAYGDRSRHPIPDLVLLDLKLPRMTGLEILEWMKSQPGLKELPVFILSSSSEPSDVERAHALGVSGYLSKKGNVGGLVELVRGLVAVAEGSRSRQAANRS